MSIIEKSSVNLINFEETFDLIWIDGAHFDPVVTMDLINSLNLLSDKGLILCDDIRKSKKCNMAINQYFKERKYH